MTELRLIEDNNIPEGALATHCAMMPKIFCCIENGTGKVFVGKNMVRSFKHGENARLKQDKIFKAELRKAQRLYRKMFGGGKLITRRKKVAWEKN